MTPRARPIGPPSRSTPTTTTSRSDRSSRPGRHAGGPAGRARRRLPGRMGGVQRAGRAARRGRGRVAPPCRCRQAHRFAARYARPCRAGLDGTGTAPLDGWVFRAAPGGGQARYPRRAGSLTLNRAAASASLRQRRCLSSHRWRARTPRRRAYAPGAMRRAGVALPFVVRSGRVWLGRETLALREGSSAARKSPGARSLPDVHGESGGGACVDALSLALTLGCEHQSHGWWRGGPRAGLASRLASRRLRHSRAMAARHGRARHALPELLRLQRRSRRG